jgi:catechol 2,3-dioxygenase-like lactoylglutathione lyase family enzyme
VAAARAAGATYHRNRWQRFWLVRDDDFTDRAESVEEERPASPAAARPKINRRGGGKRMNDSTESEGGAWPGGIAAITLFEDDLEAAKRFYQEVFRLPIHFEDENSAVFKFGETLVNLLSASEASELVEPAKVAAGDAGVRFQFTVEVDDVDAMCEELSHDPERADGTAVGDPHGQLSRPRRAYLGDSEVAFRADSTDSWVR